jgi:hypothetical protein
MLKLNPAIIELAKAYEATIKKAIAEAEAKAKAELEAQKIAPDCDEYIEYMYEVLSWCRYDYSPSRGCSDKVFAYHISEQLKQYLWECGCESKTPTVEEFINQWGPIYCHHLTFKILTEKFGQIFEE